MIAHIVLFRPKDRLKTADLRSFAQSFQAACRNIESVRRARIGRILEATAAPDLKLGDKTYSVAAVLEFDDPAGLEAYLKHPVHEELGALFWRYCGSTMVVDAEMGDPVKDQVDQLFGLEP